jgi:hypothetical protein
VFRGFDIHANGTEKANVPCLRIVCANVGYNPLGLVQQRAWRSGEGKMPNSIRRTGGIGEPAEEVRYIQVSAKGRAK